MISVEAVIQALLQAQGMAQAHAAYARACGEDAQSSAAGTGIFGSEAAGVCSSASAAQSCLYKAASSLDAVDADIRQAIAQISK